VKFSRAAMCGTHFDMLHGVEITTKLQEKIYIV